MNGLRNMQNHSLGGEEMSGKVCPRCNNIDIKEGANFCHVCGLDLRKGAADETTAMHVNAFGHSDNGVVYNPKDLVRVPKP